MYRMYHLHRTMETCSTHKWIPGTIRTGITTLLSNGSSPTLRISTTRGRTPRLPALRRRWWCSRLLLPRLLAGNCQQILILGSRRHHCLNQWSKCLHLHHPIMQQDVAVACTHEADATVSKDPLGRTLATTQTLHRIRLLVPKTWTEKVKPHRMQVRFVYVIRKN